MVLGTRVVIPSWRHVTWKRGYAWRVLFARVIRHYRFPRNQTHCWPQKVNLSLPNPGENDFEKRSWRLWIIGSIKGIYVRRFSQDLIREGGGGNLDQRFPLVESTRPLFSRPTWGARQHLKLLSSPGEMRWPDPGLTSPNGTFPRFGEICFEIPFLFSLSGRGDHRSYWYCRKIRHTR